MAGSKTEQYGRGSVEDSSQHEDLEAESMKGKAEKEDKNNPSRSHSSDLPVPPRHPPALHLALNSPVD